MSMSQGGSPRRGQTWRGHCRYVQWAPGRGIVPLDISSYHTLWLFALDQYAIPLCGKDKLTVKFIESNLFLSPVSLPHWQSLDSM